MAQAGEDRGPDPRNVGVRRVWDVHSQRTVESEANFEEREAFEERDTSGGATLVQGPPWRGQRGVHTVGEIRRGRMTGVRVVCPREVERDGVMLAKRGQVLDWGQAVALGVTP